MKNNNNEIVLDDDDENSSNSAKVRYDELVDDMMTLHAEKLQQAGEVATLTLQKMDSILNPPNPTTTTTTATGFEEHFEISGELQQLKRQLENLVAERAGLEDMLKEMKRKDDILPKLMTYEGSFEDLFRNEISKYDHICEDIAQNLDAQEQLLIHIQAQNDDFSAIFNLEHHNAPNSLLPGSAPGSRSEYLEEWKRQVGLAVPLIVVSMLQYSLQVISVMFVGHLGELPLAAASMANSFASVTAFSVLLGMGSTLETLCGQAYGAKKYHMIGIYTQRAILILLSLSIGLAFIWFYTESILVTLRQDKEISAGAGQFNRWMIPAVFAYGVLQCLTRFLQAQNIVLPMMITSGITALIHIFLCWFLVFKRGLGIKGAALANAVSYWINVIFLALYIKFSSACSRTFTGFSREALRGLPRFLKLAIPSAIMICLEFWSFEMVVLLAGLLPNPKLETSVLSICLNTCWMVYTISVGLGAAVSTRVSNELGAGRQRKARLAVIVAAVIAASEGIIVATATVLVRNVWGKLYSNEAQVIRYVARIMPLLAVSNFLDGFQCVLSGAARGCGWQNLCVVINLGAYYIVGIPSALLLAFFFHIGGMGLWTGIICGLSVQAVALVIVNLYTNWDNEARKVAGRLIA